MLNTHCMCNIKFWCIKIHRHTLLFWVHIRLSRTIIESKTNLTHTQFVNQRTIHFLIDKLTSWPITLCTKFKTCSQTIVRLPLKVYLLTINKIHLFNLYRTESHKDIILIVFQILVWWRLYITCWFERDGANRELNRLILGLIEWVSNLSIVITAVWLCTISIVTLKKPMRIKLSCRTSRGTQTNAINKVLWDKSINRTNIKLTWFIFWTCFNEVLYQCLGCKHHPFEMLSICHSLDKRVHPSLTLRQLRCSVCCPKLIITHLSMGIVYNLCFTLKLFIFDRGKGIVCHTRRTNDNSTLQEVC